VPDDGGERDDDVQVLESAGNGEVPAAQPPAAISATGTTLQVLRELRQRQQLSQRHGKWRRT
jgi:hypothetical protein